MWRGGAGWGCCQVALEAGAWQGQGSLEQGRVCGVMWVGWGRASPTSRTVPDALSVTRASLPDLSRAGDAAGDPARDAARPHAPLRRRRGRRRRRGVPRDVRAEGRRGRGADRQVSVRACRCVCAYVCACVRACVCGGVYVGGCGFSACVCA